MEKDHQTIWKDMSPHSEGILMLPLWLWEEGVKHIHILVNQMDGVSSTYILWVVQRVDVGYNEYNIFILYT